MGTLEPRIQPGNQRSDSSSTFAWELRLNWLTGPAATRRIVRTAVLLSHFPQEEAMQIVETQELVPSCHRPEVVETSELQPTCHSYEARRMRSGARTQLGPPSRAATLEQ